MTKKTVFVYKHPFDRTGFICTMDDDARIGLNQFNQDLTNYVLNGADGNAVSICNYIKLLQKIFTVI
jgi:hypothetical protein